MLPSEEQIVDNSEEIEEKSFDDFLAESKELYKNNMSFKIRSDYYDAYCKNKVNEKVILYEAFFGRGITCNTAALFYYLLEDSRFSDYTHVWALENGDFRDIILEKYSDNPNVIFVEPFTRKYYQYLSSAKYLINNVTWQNYFTKKPEQVVINTWHGIPLKHIGYDVPDGDIVADNMIRNFLMTDYLISPVPYMTEIYRNAFKLEGIFPGKIIEAGYPRVDTTLRADRNEIAEELTRYGVNYDPKRKLILYAPTYRESEFSKPDYSALDEYNTFLEIISRHINLDEYQILFKPHQLVYKAIMEQGLLQDNFIPAVVDTNALLGITDILISDYSSIFFDFLVTKRPILFYIPDLESYSEIRGLYFSTEDLPGPVSDNLEQIGSWLQDIDHYDRFFDYQKYENAMEKYVANDDGHSCERVVDAVFFGDQTYCKSLKTEKTKLLFHMDVCKKNGISSSLVNLLNALDYSKYDVSFYGSGQLEFLREYFPRFNPEVRIIKRIGARICNTLENAKVEYCVEKGITHLDNSDLFPEEFYKIEYRRSFGDAKFDYIINFSGSSAFWGNLYVAQPDIKKLIWSHSIIKNEYNRPVEGEYRLRKNLNTLLKLFKEHDAFVSCSYTTNQINTRDLQEIFGVEANFTYSRNLFNAKEVVYNSDHYLSASIDDSGTEYLAEEKEKGLINLIPMPDQTHKTFVTMGRLGVEKNQLALVSAFAKLYREYPSVKLYILGDGELAGELKRLSRVLGVRSSVVLTGNLSNPFAIMKKCDCFILPSFYEGQPMVLLEARALHMPIIVSDFESVKDSLVDQGQLVIGTSEEEIYEGLKAFMEGKVPCDYSLDIEKYNEEGLQEFEACLEFADRMREERR